jgi:hypothetical protein
MHNYWRRLIEIRHGWFHSYLHPLPRQTVIFALMMEAAGISETWINFCRTTRRISPEDSQHHTRCSDTWRAKRNGISQCPWVLSQPVLGFLRQDDAADLSPVPDHLLRSTPFQHLVKARDCSSGPRVQTPPHQLHAYCNVLLHHTKWSEQERKPTPGVPNTYHKALTVFLAQLLSSLLISFSRYHYFFIFCDTLCSNLYIDYKPTNLIVSLPFFRLSRLNFGSNVKIGHDYFHILTVHQKPTQHRCVLLNYLW